MERWIGDPTLTWIGLGRITTMAEGDIYRLNLTKASQLTGDGEWARLIRIDHSLLITELIRAEAFSGIEPQILAGVLASIAHDDDRPGAFPRVSSGLASLLGQVRRLAEALAPHEDPPLLRGDVAALVERSAGSSSLGGGSSVAARCGPPGWTTVGRAPVRCLPESGFGSPLSRISTLRSASRPARFSALCRSSASMTRRFPNRKWRGILPRANRCSRLTGCPTRSFSSSSGVMVFVVNH